MIVTKLFILDGRLLKLVFLLYIIIYVNIYSYYVNINCPNKIFLVLEELLLFLTFYIISFNLNSWVCLQL
jgi:hypothetical protein